MNGQIVCSRAGRDKDKFLVVVGIDDGMLLVCDGRERPLERPKRKNVKHLRFTNTRLDENSYKTNKSLKKALAEYRGAKGLKEEE